MDKTTERIKADALYYTKYGQPKFKTITETRFASYIAGATAENERAQKLVEVLEALVSQLPSGDTLNYYFAKTEVINARKELQQWKGTGKEVENG